MNFKKLALASAIATLPAGAFALDEINDEALSEVSGQDGISMNLVISTAGILTDIYVHDKDGINGGVGYTSYSFDGAIVIDNMQIAGGQLTTISIGIDAGAAASLAGAPVLNVNIGLPASLTIATGAIRVANSGRDAAAPSWSVDTISGTILNNMNITLNGTTLNIQLGNEQQTGLNAGTDMMVIAASVTSGIVISGFRLSDATAAAGGIGATGDITMTDNGGTNFTMNIDGNVTNAGLELGLARLGSATGMDIRIVNQYLGTSTNAALGDIAIVGLNLKDRKSVV